MCAFRFYTDPLPHQQRDFDRFKEEKKGLFFWEMGLGKTKAMLDIARYKYDTGQIKGLLVLAPSVIAPRWTGEEREKHMQDYPCQPFCLQSIVKSVKARKQWYAFKEAWGAKGMPFLAMGIESLSWPSSESFVEQFLEDGPYMVVVDEGTYIKNSKALRKKRLFHLTRDKGHSLFLLTGTALARRPTDVYTMAKWVDPTIFPESLSAFCSRYVIQQSQYVYIRGRAEKIKTCLTYAKWRAVKQELARVSATLSFTPERAATIATAQDLSISDVMAIHAGKDFSMVKNMDELKERLAPISTFLTKKDVLSLPDKVYEKVIFPVPRAQKEVIKGFLKHGVGEYEGVTIPLHKKVAFLTRVLQVCGGFLAGKDTLSCDRMEPFRDNPKIDYLLSDIEELGEQQAIVFAVFVPELKLLYEKLKGVTTCALLYGDVPVEERDRIVSDFQTGKIQILIANPMIAGYGLNLQCASVQYWYSRSYRVEARLQAEDRSYRLGITKAPVYKDLLLDITAEKAVLDSIARGRSMNDFLNACNLEELVE